MKFPTIAIVTAAATFFAASLSNADAAPRRGDHARGYHAYSATAPSTGIYLRADDAAAPLGRATSAQNHGSDARASAIRACSDMSRRYLDTTWGLMSAQLYRSCMAQHGQVE
jgi:hypothetical protein